MTQAISIFDDVFARAVQLDAGQRLTLARMLLETVEFERTPAEPEAEVEWRAELRRRAREAEEHPEHLVPWEVLREELASVKRGPKNSD